MSASIPSHIPPSADGSATSAPSAAPSAPSAAGIGAARGTSPRSGGGASKRRKAASSMGVVDAESNIQGAVVDRDGAPCDVMLARVDPAGRRDEFLAMQVIRRTTDGSLVLYVRRGRTGATGASTHDFRDKLEEAVAWFEEEFRQRTGLEWRHRAQLAKRGKYRFVTQNFAEKRAGFAGGLWQYWVDDGVDGKGRGWYDYIDSRQVERLYQEHKSNPGLCQRYLSSGRFTYHVDLVGMMQTNATHPNRTSRRIRRVDVSGGAANAAVPAPSVQDDFRGASAPQALVGHAVTPPPSLSLAVSIPIRVPSAPPAPWATRASHASGAVAYATRPSPSSQVLTYTAPLCLSVGIPSDALSAPPASCDTRDVCVICHEALEEGHCVALSACKHVFHNDCIRLAFKSNPQCPVCRASIGRPQGKSPSGTMTVSLSPVRCAGFREDSILLSYSLPGGAQMSYHDRPGRHHGGKHAAAYLPNNDTGRDLARRLKFAFAHGLSFTVGTSITTGRADQCTWASVHHKTSPSGGPRGHGYPDPGYFENCNGELDSIGVPSAQGLNEDGTAR